MPGASGRVTGFETGLAALLNQRSNPAALLNQRRNPAALLNQRVPVVEEVR
jgi:hypothetical protein